MPFLLTKSQERTLDLTSHLSVTANAGAGKTTVLARRFVEIFSKTDAPLSSVVAVTFTEQAAAELRRKIHDVILGIEGDPATDARTRARLRDVRNQLSSAVIGTIHAFCARVLRMYPAEADIDASFSVLQGQERSRLVTDSIAGAFAEYLGGAAGEEEAAAFRDLARMVTPARIESFLHSFFARREQMYRLLSTPGCDEVISGHNIRGWRAEILRALAGRADSTDWAGHAGRLTAAARGSGREKVAALLGELAGTSDTEKRMLIIGEASRGMLTAKGELRRAFAGKGFPDQDFPDTVAYLGDFHLRFGPAIGELAKDANSPGTGPHAEAVSTLLRVFVRARDLYDRRKEEQGMLDFEDLQIRTLELLRDEAIVGRVRSDYRYFLVDEFQDTNALQYSIVKALLGDFTRGNVFIVGDPKQSIYGFRNAEAEVFSEAAGDIASRAAGNPSGGNGNVVLAESFRPLPEIAAFVNYFFGRLMGDGTGSGEVKYEPLVVGREGGGRRGAVELLLSPGADSAGTHDECRQIARRIGALVSPGGGGRGGVYRYGECAVLLRDRRNLPAVEKAFEEEGVPYLLSGGVGFFQTQEVYDYLNYLAFLLSAGDDTALAGILRSPFYALPDSLLYEVALLPGSSLWEKFSAAADRPDTPGSIRRARGILETHRALADRIPVPRLLRRISRDTGWLGTMAGLSHGPQRRENFLKLLELAREREATGPVSLWDFREFLDHHATAEEREAQASTTPGSDAVRVMTIHAAKGLEFPVVCIPFLDRKFRGDSEPYIDPVYGVGFSIGDPAGGDTSPGPVAAFLRAVSNEKRTAEEKRILYVGCTRARDVLLLSGRGTPGGAAPDSSPLAWILGILPAPDATGEIRLGRCEISVLSRAEGSVTTERRMVEPVISLRAGVEAGGPPKVVLPPGEEPPRRRLLVSPVPDLSGGETYSATQVKMYLECPAKYYLAYVVGMGAAPGRPGDGPGNGHAADRDDEREMAGLEGTLTHRMLSGVDGRTTREEILERIPGLILSVSVRGVRVSGELADRVVANAAAFIGSGAGKKILSREDARTEFGVFATLDDVVLTGILDRVYRGEDGRMEFVDYKTDAVSADEIPARAESYRPQMAMYALLVGRLFGQSGVIGRLLFLKDACREVTFEFSDADIEEFSGRVREAIAGIRARDFSPPADPCHGCPYRVGKKCQVAPGIV